MRKAGDLVARLRLSKKARLTAAVHTHDFSLLPSIRIHWLFSLDISFAFLFLELRFDYSFPVDQETRDMWENMADAIKKSSHEP